MSSKTTPPTEQLEPEKRGSTSGDNRFQDFANAASEWFWEMGPDLRFTYISERYFRITGFRPEEKLGTTRTELLDPKDFALDEAKWRCHFAVLAAREPFRGFEFAFKNRDGEVRHARISGIPIFDESGQFAGYRGIGTDITATKRAEEALRTSEDRFRRLVEGSIQGIAVHRNWRLLFANQAMADIVGYDSPEDILAQESVENLIAPQELDRLRIYRDMEMSIDEAPIYVETKLIRRDGTFVWVEGIRKAVTWDGKLSVISTFVDIDDRKKAEQALKANNERFRALIEHALDIITILGPHGTILFQSPSVERVLGYRPEALVGRPVVEFLHPEDKQPTLDALQRITRASGSISEIEVRFRHRDGSWRYLQVIVRNLLEHPSVAGIVLNSRDTSERKQAEAKEQELVESLYQAQKMEAIGLLTGGIAHDFNNVLAVILGNLGLLGQRIGIGDKNKEYQTRAITATERGAALTQRLLAFARKQTLAVQDIDVGILLDDMDDMLRRSLGETIEIEVERSAGLWLCEADPGQLEQAVLNLAVNARDAMPSGGRLTIEASNTEIDEHDAAEHAEVTAGEYVLLSVSDTGSGIATEVQKQIFDPFFTTKEVGKGTGLRLSMVFGFIKQSGGHISVSSEEGKGTVFHLYLPRSKAAAPTPRANNTAELTLAEPGTIILAVEDDADLRELVEAMLESLGYEVVVAGNGSEALDVLSIAPNVDLLLTDVVLPGGMSGTELAKSALEKRPSLRILYMSGYNENSIAHEGRLDLGVELLAKPFTIDHLGRKLRTVLES